MSADLRIHPILCVPELLGELGVRSAAVLERAGIDLRAFDSPENRVPFEAVGRLLADCAVITERPHFGLLVGQRAGAAVTGVIGELARHSTSVRSGLRALIAHFHLHDRGALPVLLSRSPREAELAYVIHHRDTPGTSQISDGAMAIGFHLMRSLCGPRWKPIEVTFSHSRPLDLTPYRCFFRAPVRFNAPRAALVFAARWLDEPIAGADPGAHAHLSRLIAELEASKSSSVTEQVRCALSRVMVGAKPSVDQIARVLGCSRRTLHRRLAAEGTTIHRLVDEVRFELARQLLGETRIPLSEIAATLHYSELSAFSRAFKAWTGTTPSDCRAQAEGLGRGRELPPRE
jgi:AraC-like DNA-binding protein